MNPGGRTTQETRFRCKEESMSLDRNGKGGSASSRACWRGNDSSQAGSVLEGGKCHPHPSGNPDDHGAARRGERRERGLEGHIHGAPS